MAVQRPCVIVSCGAWPVWRGLVLAIATSQLPLTIAQAAEANDQGWKITAMCASCHRLDGRDRGIPPIVGLSEGQLTRAMLADRSGERTSHIMQAVALSLSDEEIATVARYLAAQGKKAVVP